MGAPRLRFCPTDFPVSGTIDLVASRLRYPFVFCLSLLAAALLTWGLWPTGQNEQTLILSPENIQIVRLSSPLLLRLRTPNFARAGDTLAVQLQCIPQGETANTGNISPAVLARARLELMKMNVRPASAVSQPLLDDSLLFYWHISSRDTGTYYGRLWVHIETVPTSGESANQEQALAAMPVEIRVHTFLGLTGAATRTAGAIAALTAIVWFGLPYVFMRHPDSINNKPTK